MADHNPPLTASRVADEPRATNERAALDDDAVLRIERGRAAPPVPGAETPAPPIEHIPWGYGRDRLTAMVVDPNRLYLYWELTDPCIEKARQGLGPAGREAWLCLRIYDVTGRIFDGTNAHSYFDIKVDRGDRQWFMHIGKPSSSHLVELGLKSYEGYFVKIVRSGRADFPRFEPSPDGTVEWLTVRALRGGVGEPSRGAPPSSSPGGGGGGGPGAPGGPDGSDAHGSEPHGAGGGTAVEARGWNVGGRIERHENGVHHAGVERWEDGIWTGWQEIFHTEWIDGRSFFEWVGPVLRSGWEMGPFPLPVSPPGVVEERYVGPVSVFPVAGGRTRVTYGPWEVVVRGLGAKADAKVVARWEIAASWVVQAGFERVVRALSPLALGAAGPDASSAAGDVMLGGSEAFGSSERRWLAGSEVRLRGASELHLLGASELRYGGASEIMYGGASERMTMGSSERRFGGASEYRWAGASEHRIGGGSEQLGASEQRWGGASERLGGSETRWGGASEYPLGPDPRVAGEYAYPTPPAESGPRGTGVRR